VSHAVYYILEHTEPGYETQACMEMVNTLTTGARPFRGETIKERENTERCKRYCLFCVLGFFALITAFLMGKVT
jgi:hypothetical protein